MKKTVTIFFLIIYSCTTFGAPVHMHYCMSKYVGASLFHSKGKKCPICGTEKSKSNGCCKDEHKFIGLKREHQKTATTYDFSVLNNPVVVPSFILHDHVSTCSIIRACSAIHPPPGIQGQRLYILNSLFLI